MEKRDAEQLARLRAGQEIALLDAVRAVKLATIAEAEGNVAALELSRKVVEERQRYYAGRPYMNAWEITATALSGVSLLGETAIAVGYILSGGLKLIPNFTAGGAGFGGSPTVTLTLGGDKAGAAADSAVMTLEAIARALDKAAGMAANQGGYRRRMDDWEHQAALAGLELTQLDQQLLTGRLHVAMLTDELAAHDREADNARATEEYLRGKYTNTELYQWMVSRASSVYFGAYQLAFDVAKKAERCFAHELGSEATFLQPGYWDSLRKGLTVADALRHDLKRMEVAYLDRHSRERELTRHVSLAQLDPAALIELRATGSCVVNVPEALFDLDHPGHYFRRLRTVSLSIPCVAGPYTPVTAKLSLIGNRYRTATAARQGATSAKDKYAEVPGDERFAYNVGGIESISTSSGLSDSGMFELNFADDRYLPFEGKGAIGTWRLELPTAVRQFDYDSISDVILHLRYTARDGGSTLRGLVEDSLREVLNEMLVDAGRTGLYQAYSLRHHFPDEWWQLTQQQSTALTIGPEHLPYLARDHQPVVDQVTWYARVDGDPGTYDLTVAGDPVTLNRDADLRQCVGQSDPPVLGTPVTLGGRPGRPDRPGRPAALPARRLRGRGDDQLPGRRRIVGAGARLPVARLRRPDRRRRSRRSGWGVGTGRAADRRDRRRVAAGRSGRDRAGTRRTGDHPAQGRRRDPRHRREVRRQPGHRHRRRCPSRSPTSRGPVRVPPDLALGYDSGAGNGPFGFGWQLPVPAITAQDRQGPAPLRRHRRRFILSGRGGPGPGARAATSDRSTAAHGRSGTGRGSRACSPASSGGPGTPTATCTGATTVRVNTADRLRPRRRLPHRRPGRRGCFTWLLCETRDDQGNAVTLQLQGRGRRRRGPRTGRTSGTGARTGTPTAT